MKNRKFAISHSPFFTFSLHKRLYPRRSIDREPDCMVFDFVPREGHEEYLEYQNYEN
jgi:hypothetical protein